jgi:hypothetical protein
VLSGRDQGEPALVAVRRAIPIALELPLFHARRRW